MRVSGLLLPIISGLVSAQTTYSIDPDSVSSSTRDTWCSNQKSACPLICLQTSANSSSTEENTCDPDTLDFTCVCSNGITPNASQYSLTIPYYICTEWGNECVSNCGDNNTCSYDCRANHPCGAQSPNRVNVTTTSSSATASATGASNSAGAAASTTGSSGSSGAAALQLGQTYGLFVVAASMFGGFALLL